MRHEKASNAATQKNTTWIVRSLVMLLVLLALCGVAWVRSIGIPFGVATLGIGVIFLGMAPGMIFLANPRLATFPLFPLNCSFYAISVGYGVFRTVKDPRYIVAEVSIEQALTFLVLGLSAQIVVYYVTIALPMKFQAIRFSGDLSENSLLQLGWVLMGIRLLQIALPQLNNIPSLGQFTNLCGVVGTALLYSLRNAKAFGRVSQILLFFAVVPIEMLSRATSGSIANLMMYCMLFIIIRWMLEKRVAWFFLITLIVGYAVLAPLKGQYREQTWNGQNSEATILTKAAIYYEIIVSSFDSSVEAIDTDLMEASLDRFNQLPLYQLVVERTPEQVPYWNGETLSGALYIFIPRFIWQGKPNNTLGNDFGHRYQILGAEDRNTSINLCWNIELYANFGLWGVTLGMGLIGFTFAMIERKAGGESDNQIDRVIVIALTLSLAYPESNISIMWGGLILNTLAIFAIFRLFAAFTRSSSFR